MKNDSLALVTRAANCLRELRPPREFHIIRTGGVESAADVEDSLAAGASLVEWYTGYFEQFSSFGHGAYRQVLQQLEARTLTRGG